MGELNPQGLRGGRGCCCRSHIPTHGQCLLLDARALAVLRAFTSDAARHGDLCFVNASARRGQGPVLAAAAQRPANSLRTGQPSSKAGLHQHPPPSIQCAFPRRRHVAGPEARAPTAGILPATPAHSRTWLQCSVKGADGALDGRNPLSLAAMPPSASSPHDASGLRQLRPQQQTPHLLNSLRIAISCYSGLAMQDDALSVIQKRRNAQQGIAVKPARVSRLPLAPASNPYGRDRPLLDTPIGPTGDSPLPHWCVFADVAAPGEGKRCCMVS
ncbi:uncharacterized protein BDZ99DRAFT_500306 [Mytilinidion resinicola]|uniref:Uncharacterized protein n=1 Tax=Mytilinidion resinicola TaxID=574789 RepID=A0A6A6YGV2_9PEZI|nr:uncharacterized protein BDZ99DRAFT_500306 [Mytilinidion resinicola]KAF2808042.1 hypothetical protein BDZ99DRAFT_500306 [Mytilinidion resinicola]